MAQTVTETFTLPDADIIFYPQVFSPVEGDDLLQELLRTTAWKQERIRVYGREVASPRLTAWYGDAGKVYRYSGLTLTPQAWTEPLLHIKGRVETLVQTSWNSVLLNLYRHQRDSVSWHSDDEAGLGPCPVIGSVSLGATRRFQLRHNQDHSLRHSIELPHGSVLIMRGLTQHCWQHCVPKASKPLAPRINLTFRQIVS